MWVCVCVCACVRACVCVVCVYKRWVYSTTPFSDATRASV